MTEQELDVAYTALCRALGEAGPENAERFLAMVCLGLMVRCERAEDVMAVIDTVSKHREGDNLDTVIPAKAGMQGSSGPR